MFLDWLHGEARTRCIAIANNALMAYANKRRVHDALMNQDLIVACEHSMSPTAQIADYVLPGDAWLEAEFGPTSELPRGPEGKVLRSNARPDDFMYDEITGDGVEFEAMALSIYGRTSSM